MAIQPPASSDGFSTAKTYPEREQRHLATLGGGCFWCLDAVFREIQGIEAVSSGFSGGDEENPAYERVCSGHSRHIEVIQIEFDPLQLSYQTLLGIFFAAHDPTQTDGQGHDIGPQYRSVIFFHNPEQQQTARQVITTLDSEALWPDKIVTALRPYHAFYPAPPEHQDFYQKRTAVPYCQIIIRPKLEKIRRLFSSTLKPAARHTDFNRENW